MFRVPTYLGPSQIHGTGVFTPHSIAAGTLLWDFTPEVDLEISEPDLHDLPEALRERFMTYVYQRDDGVYVLCGDNAKFMNHSTAPNCDDSGERTIAARDIEPGEELTCDYRGFDRISRETWGRNEDAPYLADVC